MTPILPAKEAVARKGWKYQVQWVEKNKPCFSRHTTLAGANYCCAQLEVEGLDYMRIDLHSYVLPIAEKA